MPPFLLRSLIALIIIIGLSTLIYSNTFHASWHLDDNPNIITNYHLHLKTLQPRAIINTWFSNPSDPFHLNTKLYRPVACLSFALNWYFGQNSVFGYHIVNTTIHILTAFFLYLFIINLFNSPNLYNKFNNKHFIALLTAILWAVNPIQTQAVTYIVQRMTLLAAMFYILGLYSYIKARNSYSVFKIISWFISCFIFYLLAMGSKENAAIFPVALLFIEALFFQNLGRKQTRYIFLWSTLGICILFIVFSSYYFLNGSPLSFLNGYSYRPFTLTERLFAESRIIIFYLNQIFFPVPWQFSITHDIILSKSIFTPWTTIPSILIIISLIGIGICKIRKNPLLFFSIFFYFLNHLIESTVIPLELIFEHRNYLPSFFLFLPFAIIINKILVTNKNNYLIFTMITTLIIIVTISICHSTFVRNKVWIDDKTLWTDAMIKAPNSARPLNNVAIELAWGNNSIHPKRYDMALKLFEKALDKYQSRLGLEAGVIGNMALIYSNNKKNYEKAVTLYNKALTIQPKNKKIRHDLVNTLIHKSDWNKALKNVNMLITKNDDNEVYYNLKGFILLWQGNYKEALQSLNKAFKITPDKTAILMTTGVTLNLTGNHKIAELLLLRAAKNAPHEIMILFYLIENSIRAGDKIKEKRYSDKLFTLFDLPTIKTHLDSLSTQRKYPPVSLEVVLPVINNLLIDKALEVNQ